MRPASSSEPLGAPESRNELGLPALRSNPQHNMHRYKSPVHGSHLFNTNEGYNSQQNSGTIYRQHQHKTSSQDRSYARGYNQQQVNSNGDISFNRVQNRIPPLEVPHYNRRPHPTRQRPISEGHENATQQRISNN
ncbi:hypothetical protein BGZ94_000977, partial [Podila epigama]